MIDINLTGTFLCCQALGRACRDDGHGGAIVNVSSMSGRVVNVPAAPDLLQRLQGRASTS